MSHLKKPAFPNLPRARKGSNPPRDLPKVVRGGLTFALLLSERSKYALRERGRELFCSRILAGERNRERSVPQLPSGPQGRHTP